MDESNKQLIGDVQPPLPVKAGQAKREDSTHKRDGTRNLFMAFEPARGQPEVTVREHRKREDWALSFEGRGHGYATEAARALIDYAFGALNLRRIIATTGHANVASIAVMRRVGMRIEKNPYPDPPWLQVVGVLENTDR